MKKLLCVVLWFLPVMVFAQSPFDGTWKTNMAEAKPVSYTHLDVYKRQVEHLT